MYNGLYPVNIKPYTPPVKKKQENINKDPEKFQSQTQEAGHQDNSSYQDRRSAIDYNAEKITINQVLSDFGNTIAAIGAPKEIQSEVQNYLNLVETQANKEKPSKNIIQSNLRNAAYILDEHIASALKKPSKVVIDWVNALLLQNIDYKSEQTLAEVSNQKNELQVDESETTKASATTQNPIHPVQKPQQLTRKVNKKLFKFFKHSENLYKTGEIEKALGGYEKTLMTAQKLDDKFVQSKVSMRMGHIYNSKNQLAEALTCYNNAAVCAASADDMQTQSQAHYNMAIVYDEIGKTDIAGEHYFQALALDGESENLERQVLSLNGVGEMLSSRYDYKSAMVFYNLAYEIAKDNNDSKGIALSLGNSANVLKNTGSNQKALKHYKNAIKYDLKNGNSSNTAVLYAEAGDVMKALNQPQKAEILYKKATLTAKKIGDNKLFFEIQKKQQDQCIT